MKIWQENIGIVDISMQKYSLAMKLFKYDNSLLAATAPPSGVPAWQAVFTDFLSHIICSFGIITDAVRMLGLLYCLAAHLLAWRAYAFA